jgi:competence protein ComEC
VCLAAVKGRKVAFLTEKAEQDFSCPEVDLVIAAFPLRGRCRNVPRRIDRFDVWRHGAHAIYIADGVMKVATAREWRGTRPWVVEPKPRKRNDKKPQGK